MIRKTVIALLMLAGLVTLVLGSSSFFTVVTVLDIGTGIERIDNRWEISFDLGTGRTLEFVSDRGSLNLTYWLTSVIHNEAEVLSNPLFKSPIIYRWDFLTVLHFTKIESGSDSNPLPPRIYRGWSFVIEFWVLFVILVTYPTIAFIRGPLRRYRRRRKGLCVKCGYNLTGNTTGVCSECGVEIQS